MTVAIYGGNGWVGKQMQELFRAKNIPHQVAAMRIGTNSDAEVRYFKRNSKRDRVSNLRRPFFCL
jgi:predicted DNA-binding protein with PD1-like motif